MHSQLLQYALEDTVCVGGGLRRGWGRVRGAEGGLEGLGEGLEEGLGEGCKQIALTDMTATAKLSWQVLVMKEKEWELMTIIT